jgi:hypothetical protein
MSTNHWSTIQPSNHWSTNHWSTPTVLSPPSVGHHFAPTSRICTPTLHAISIPFSAFWLRSSVVSVLSSVITRLTHTRGSMLLLLFLLREYEFGACSISCRLVSLSLHYRQGREPRTIPNRALYTTFLPRNHVAVAITRPTHRPTRSLSSHESVDAFGRGDSCTGPTTAPTSETRQSRHAQS